MNQLQAMFNGISAEVRDERAGTQMTLGKLISMLSNLHPSSKVKGFAEPHSYRGYYSDLAFEPEGETTVGELLKVCREECMGQMFTGYKGGDFWMVGNTPIFIAHYGNTGPRLMDIITSMTGIIEAVTQHEEE